MTKILTVHVQVFARLRARIVATVKAAVISLLGAPALTLSAAVIATSPVISMMTAAMTLTLLRAP